MNLRMLFLFALLLGIAAPPLSAQDILPLDSKNYVGAYQIEVSFNKTTHLIFPYEISYVDLGSPDVIADKVENVKNILKVKANVASFKHTNLTVVTTAGRYFSFIVSYKENPSQITIVLQDNPPTGGGQGAGSKPDGLTALRRPGVVPASAQFMGVNYNEVELNHFSRTILRNKRNVRDVGAMDNQMTFALNGLYIKDNAFFFHLNLKNRSNINYDIDFIRFYVRDKKTLKNSPAQQVEIRPEFVFNGKISQVPGNGETQRVYVLKKMTIPDDKDLVIELFEHDGGRHLSMKVSNSDLLTAGLLPNLMQPQMAATR